MDKALSEWPPSFLRLSVNLNRQIFGFLVMLLFIKVVRLRKNGLNLQKSHQRELQCHSLLVAWVLHGKTFRPTEKNGTNEINGLYVKYRNLAKWLSTKLPHQKLRSNYGILHSGETGAFLKLISSKSFRLLKMLVEANETS